MLILAGASSKNTGIGCAKRQTLAALEIKHLVMVVLGWVSAIDSQGRTIWIVDAHRDDGRRFIAHADEILTAFVELEREVLTVTFYLASINAGDEDSN
jgi:hypothetical protein